MTIRRFLAAVALAAVVATPAAAQDFPTKPINLVIPFGPGGSSDLTSRTFVGLSSEVFKQPMIIHLKGGGGGAIGTEFVAQSRPDGYTLLVGHPNCNSILPAMEGRSKGPDDLVPVCRINTQGALFLGAANAPFKDLKEMIAWAKANPGKLSVSSAGTWSVPDFAFKQMEQVLGIKLRIVSYDGGAEALVALLGGHVQASLLSPTQSLPHVRAGKIKALAYFGERRFTELPDLPTAREQGYEPLLTVWKGILAPKGTPRPVVDKLAAGFKKMFENPQAKDAIKKLGDEFDYQGPDEFEKFWRADFQTYKELGKIFKK